MNNKHKNRFITLKSIFRNDEWCSTIQPGMVNETEAICQTWRHLWTKRTKRSEYGWFCVYMTRSSFCLCGRANQFEIGSIGLVWFGLVRFERNKATKRACMRFDRTFNITGFKSDRLNTSEFCMSMTKRFCFYFLLSISRSFLLSLFHSLFFHSHRLDGVNFHDIEISIGSINATA